MADEINHVGSFLIKIGDRFKSFEELETKIKSYEKATSTKYWMRDSRTVNAAMKRTTRTLSEAIKYYQIGYRCIHGGRKFVPKGEGKRSTQTFKKDCEACISLCASENGRELVVTRFNDQHNHEVRKELFRQLPQQRKLSAEEKNEAKKLLTLRANKKILKKDLQLRTGKVVLLKDLSNIATASKSENTRNNLEACVKQLIEKHDAFVEVLPMKIMVFKDFFCKTPT